MQSDTHKIDKSYRRQLHTVVDNLVPESVIEEGNKKKSWTYGYNQEYDLVVISKDGTLGQTININGLNIGLPAIPKRTLRFSADVRENQKWSRYSVPDELRYFDRIFSGEDNVDSKINEIADKYKKFIDADFYRIENGDWLYIDGEPIYISCGYYFFLQHYFLPEDGMYPQFRMPQRDYFIWLEACEADTRCVGSLLLKSRRSAFTVTSSSEILRSAIRNYNAYYPIMADVEKHAKTIFSNYIVKPFQSLPKHLQPQRTGNANPKSELVLDAPKRKFSTNSKMSSEMDGLGTIIAPTATTLNAYDSTRPKKSFNDEIGKPEIDITAWWAVHKKCHIEGVKRKGFALCGSTANPPERGGKAYKILYENSKFDTRNKSGFTKSGLYSIFIKADFAQSGFFDEWGHVVYEDTNYPTLRDDGEMRTQGSKSFLDEKEAANIDDISLYNFEKRQDPRVETDPFLDAEAKNMYATAGMLNLNNFLKEFQHTPKYKSNIFRFDLVWKNGEADSDEVEMVRNSKGKFSAYAPSGLLPIPLEFRNKFERKTKGKAPVNSHLAGFGVDPFTANRAQFGGSKQGLVGMTTKYADLSDIHKEITWLWYNFRGNTYEEAVEDVIKACVYFSIKALVERNKDSLVKDMCRRGYRNYIANDPFKLKKDLNNDDIHYGGVYSLNNIDKQEQRLHTYINMEFPEEIEEDKIKSPFLELNEHASEYTRENRKFKDDVVAWQLARATTSQDITKKEPLIIQTASDIDINAMFEFNTN